MDQCVLLFHLHMISSKDPVQDEVSPEHGPLTLDVLEQFEFCWIVVESGRVLVTQRAEPQTSLLKYHTTYKYYSVLHFYFGCYVHVQQIYFDVRLVQDGRHS